MKKFLAVISIGLFCVLMINSYFQKTELAIARSFIRLHVIAESDMVCDQELKLKVRDRVISSLDKKWDLVDNVDEAKELVYNNIDMIKKEAEDEIRKNGYDYSVDVSLENSDFPTKSYGEVELPAGKYEALKVKIGSAKGKNWWCVLFPPLCFVDESLVECDDSLIEANMDSTSYEMISKDKTPAVRFKFKSYEMWQLGKQKIASLLK